MQPHGASPNPSASPNDPAVPPAAAAWPGLAVAALTTWIGVHALRTFLAMVVWNIGEDMPANTLGLIALGIWAIGFLAWPAARVLGGARPEMRLGTLFAIAYVVNQWVSHPVLTPVLGPATVVLWLWVLPAMVVAVGRRGASGALAPGIMMGLAAQVALQNVLAGLDMPMLRGAGPGLVALVLGAMLWYSLRAVASPEASEHDARAGGGAWPGAGLAALGPFLVIQMVLLANPGRVQMLTGLGLTGSSAVILLGLAAGAAAMSWAAPFPVGPVAGLLAAAALAQPSWLPSGGIWLIPLAQVLLGACLAAALGPSPRGRPGRVYAWTLAGMMLFFILMFLYYSKYTWEAMWPVMTALAAVPAFARTAAAGTGAERSSAGTSAGAAVLRAGSALSAVAAIVIVAVVGGAIGLAMYRPAPRADGPAPAELKILNYNVHQAFNYWSVPDPEAVARVIEASGADLVSLQEVGRGWNINGGPDLVAWLRRRLPHYHVVYGPMNGDLWGNAILSRYPIRESGWVRYPVRVSAFQRGHVWALIPTAAGDLLFVSTHFSAYEDEAEDRVGQAGDLLEFWKQRPRAIIAGDFNAEPDEEPVRRLLAGGLADVPARHGLGTAFTFSSGNPYQRIDYIFASPDVESLSASIPRTTASDHLPVEARIRLR